MLTVVLNLLWLFHYVLLQHQQQLQLNRIESLLTNEINSLREENHRLQQENTRLKTLY